MIELISRRNLKTRVQSFSASGKCGGWDSADIWGYRRWPIDWPMHGRPLPSPTGGDSALILGLDFCVPELGGTMTRGGTRSPSPAFVRLPRAR